MDEDDIDEFGAKVDEIGVVTINEVDEFIVDGGKVVVELKTKTIEGNEGIGEPQLEPRMLEATGFGGHVFMG
ncbi:hypothetical protein RJT34_08851 [Clitoria ternatea]|uniref:Uncharacterized protein n=1 Tax=Clitoria ternatea TaxID=43366 RepID=A0AAN9K6C6_CLITE